MSIRHIISLLNYKIFGMLCEIRVRNGGKEFCSPESVLLPLLPTKVGIMNQFACFLKKKNV